MNGSTRALPALTLFVLVTILPAGPSRGSPARLNSGPGTLAARAADAANWSVLRPGDSLPDRSSLRTAADGPVSVDLDTALLCVGPDARLEIDVKARRVTVQRGRAFLRLAAQSDRGWTLAAGDFAAQFGSESAAENQ